MTTPDAVDELREFETIRPPWVVAGADIIGASDLVDGIRVRDKQIQILITTTGKLEKAVAAFQERADEFIALPAVPMVLSSVLRRMEKGVRLRRSIRSLSENRVSRARDSVREIIETERFLAVRQIVEKMSAFISQVASDAQGGMRYFNELPYFVSIHGKDCTVLTNSEGLKTNVMAWTSPIKTASGKLIQVLVIFADVTRLRYLQANLGLMVSTLSHDLNGSLTRLDAGLYLIDSGFYRNMPARIEEGLDAARLMTERIRKLVADILQFAGGVAANVANKVRGANIQFNPQIPEAPLEAVIDTDLIRTVLYNIIDNAIEACIESPSTSQHRIDFSVAAGKVRIFFAVQDTGGGMSPERAKTVFDLFASTKGDRGTGIGLSVTRKIVNKHGGTISVDSRPGEGSRFAIELPLGKVASLQEA